ncbi:MAG: hypothetical protein H6807_10040 [Planctomycetes bacterium]|nr:hypothetical protein [Planctomycetota bacterium]
MVNLGFGGNESVRCEGCGTEIPAFLDACPYCQGEDEGDETLPCPSCGAEIHEDSQQCPVCDDWVRVTVPRSRARFSTGVIALVLTLLAIAFFLRLVGR